MKNKNRDVILDFTSLLDIILIILFFFILYTAFNVEKAELRAETARSEYEDMSAALEAEKARLGEEQTRLQAEWDRVLALDENAARNQQALIAFNNGAMLSFNLQKEDGSDAWRLSAVRRREAGAEEETVGEIRPGDELKSSILGLIEAAGFAEDDVLIVTFTYNGNVIGSHRLYVEIMKAFQAVQAERKNVYLNAVNTSK
jgi:hypothetical protein